MGAETILTGAGSTPPVDDQQQVANTEGAETKPEESVEGLKQALIAERKEKQEFKQRLDAQERAIQFMQMAQQNQQQQPAAVQQGDPDDIISRRELESALQQTRNSILNDSRQTRLARYEQEARTKHADYDEVVQLADNVAQRNPGLDKVILNMENPFEAAYQAGKLHPNYQKATEQKVTQQVAKTLEQNLNRPKTLSDVSGGSVKQSVDYQKLAVENPKEYNKLINKAMGLT